MAFSPDGRRLASGSGHWDGLVRITETSVAAEDLRRREVVGLVREQFDQLLLRSEVLASLQRNPFLDAADRTLASELVQTHKDNPEQLNSAAWQVVKSPGRDRDTYARAVRQAEAAVQAAPGDGIILNTLGVAHYRLGEYARALEVLERSEKLNATKDGSEPTDLAFLAMSRHRLGQVEQAQATLRRLREVMKQQPWAGDAGRQGFLREAEALIDGKVGDKKK
jgi:tetratricopeptide (TPR) repeat protein